MNVPVSDCCVRDIFVRWRVRLARHICERIKVVS